MSKCQPQGVDRRRDMGKPTSAPQANSKDNSIPVHVAIIMDGNGRWAEERGLSRLEGHRAGTENLRQVIRTLGKRGVRYLTIYAFSTENWRRPEREVQGLMDILRDTIFREVEELHRENVRLRHIGRLDRISEELRETVRSALERTRSNTGLTLVVAFDYGGREEILRAVQRLLQDGVLPDQVNEELMAQHLDTHDIPNPDLIIRTSGEERLSNFLLWQGAYSEYYFTPCYWPDFGEVEMEQALAEYSRRHRRFGGLIEEPR